MFPGSHVPIYCHICWHIVAYVGCWHIVTHMNVDIFIMERSHPLHWLILIMLVT